jgi:DUF2075 family protein
MPAFYRASVVEFLSTSHSELTGRLSVAYAQSGFTSQRASQTLAWTADILRLHEVLTDIVQRNPTAYLWSILLEFPIPKKEKRIDVVLLTGGTILILELKSTFHGIDNLRQAEEYALLLHYFHRPSHQRRIVSFVVATNAPALVLSTQQFLPILEAPAYWIEPARVISWDELRSFLVSHRDDVSQDALDLSAWDDGEYRPVPTIIDAARSLQAGLSVREVAHSRAARHDVEALTQRLRTLIDEARANHSFAICFVTGVPGSGKTLVGLNLAFASTGDPEPIHFMSGTGPLVKVLQAVLARHHQETTQAKAQDARIYAKTLLENVHIFAKYYTDENPDRAPSNHIIIFDEAQRAWDLQQNMSKFRRPYSEPEMLLRIMERHEDWAVVIALVGGGQEINSGEAGIEEWARALSAAAKPWKVFASPEALEGGASVAGSKLDFASASHRVDLTSDSALHLHVAVRSLQSASYAAWVNYVVSGDEAAAAALNIQDTFPILLTRSLRDLRTCLKENQRGQSRCGLVASSGAARIRAEGLEPDSTFHGEYPWDHWYLADPTDVRSSFQLEVFATEFEIQGLELDWIGLCWGGDFIWSPSQSRWLVRALRNGKVSRWSEIPHERRQTYRRNAYRVLLTRARQGVVIFVPSGDPNDPTRNPKEFDATADFLIRCGARAIV